MRIWLLLFKLLLLFIVLFLYSFLYSLGADLYPKREIQVVPMLNLNALNPKIDFTSIYISNNCFAMDMNENLYFLDMQNHRILKFTKKGNFIKQIGKIGQGNEELYYPKGIFIKDNYLFVLNDLGRSIKVFSLKGDFLYKFSIDNAYRSHSLYVFNDLILIDVKYNDKEKYNKNKLISIFNEKGQIIKKIGKILKSQKYIGYLHFNSIFINVVDKKIFGAFNYYPVVFCYDFEGKELFYRDLGKAGVREIGELIKLGKEKGVDNPESIKREKGIFRIIYCRGFAVDKNKHIFYSLNVKNKGLLLHIKESGEIMEEIILKKGKVIVLPLKLYIQNNIHYVIGKIKKDYFLLKF